MMSGTVKCITLGPVLFVCLVSGPALVPVSCDGADVEEVLAVLAQGVLGRLVTGLEMLGQCGSVWAQQLAEVAPAPLPVHWSWNRKT